MISPCTHLDQIQDVQPRTPDGCEECLQAGDRWVHLRLCLICGHVGCCDSSPNKHATKHFHATQHPIVQSFEPDEDWAWCYVDQLVLELSDVRAPRDTSAKEADGDETTGKGRSAGSPGGLLSRLLGAAHHRNYVVGVLDNHDDARRTGTALQDSGFAPDDVVMQTGQDIQERMQRNDLGNLVREATTEEGTICRDYNDLARDGAILSVYTASPEEVERARKVMVEHGAHSLKHFGDWTISELPDQLESA